MSILNEDQKNKKIEDQKTSTCQCEKSLEIHHDFYGPIPWFVDVPFPDPAKEQYVPSSKALLE